VTCCQTKMSEKGERTRITAVITKSNVEKGYTIDVFYGSNKKWTTQRKYDELER
jgi:hypothetical protein